MTVTKERKEYGIQMMHPRALKFLLPPLCSCFLFWALTLTPELPIFMCLSLVVEGPLSILERRRGGKNVAKTIP